MKMIIGIISSLILSFLFVSCQKEIHSSIEKTYIKVEDKEWYRNLMIPCNENTVCKTSIVKALFSGDTVYYTTLSGALCDPVFSATLLNVDGQVVKTYWYTDISAFNKEVTFIQTTFRCDQH